MTEEKVTVWDQLRADLPKEALAPLTNAAGYGSGMTTINKAHVIKRLNDIAEWSLLDLKFEDMPRTVQTKDGPVDGYESVCNLTIGIEGRTYLGVGGHWAIGWGDARKGAKTDAFGNACKDAGIGLHVWLDKDEVTHTERASRDEATARAKEATAALGKPWPTCSVHGDTLTAKVAKNGKAMVSCPKKNGDGTWCDKVIWEDKLPPTVLAAIRGESAESEAA